MSDELRRFFADVWERCHHVEVVINPQAVSVKLPIQLTVRKSLLLDIRRGDYARNMVIGGFGFAVELVFNGVTTPVYIPWDSIYTVTDPARNVSFAGPASVSQWPSTVVAVVKPPERRRTKVPFMFVIDGGKKSPRGGNGGGPNVA